MVPKNLELLIQLVFGVSVNGVRRTHLAGCIQVKNLSKRIKCNTLRLLQALQVNDSKCLCEHWVCVFSQAPILVS